MIIIKFSPSFYSMQKCPKCGSDDVNIEEYITDISYIGRIFVYSFLCNDCGYKNSGYMPLEQRDPIKKEIVVSGEKDFYKKIIKSPFAIIKIPDINFEIIPGIDSKMWIKNIDSFLNEVLDVLKTFMSFYSEDESKKKIINSSIRKIENVLKNKDTITIILEDPYGLSDIVE